MDRQARTGDTLLVKSVEIRGRSQTCCGGWGEEGRDDRKQNALAPSHAAIQRYLAERPRNS